MSQTDKARAGQKSLLAFVIFLMLWTSAFIKAWTREDNTLSYDWDSIEGAVDKAASRPQFTPDEETDENGDIVPKLRQGFYSERGWIDLEDCKWADFPPEGFTKESEGGKWKAPRKGRIDSEGVILV